tara:strand:+ start:566 stop:1276 length:711 start_codon:yes stop_codon:yes gene_type:complete
MKTHIHESVRDEKGFTLVELAIVMVIIGLLIGGILKGQEMIANAQVSATVAQIKGVTAATNTFQDMFDALPGDITNPGTRLTNCAAAPCNAVGNGNSQIGGVPGTVAGENLSFWAQLNAADLLTGVDGSNTAAWGRALPSAKAGGGLTVGFTATGALTTSLAAAARGGHYIMLQGVPGTIASPALSGSEAARMDRKMDDGAPGTGSVIGSGDATCGTATTYTENADQVACAISARL